jgi:glucan biosynthesis protein C
MTENINISAENPTRQYYLDWIRLVTIILVFLFHCGRFFDSDDWHVKNAATSGTADVLSFFMVQWMMPLFFFISGASTWLALQSKSSSTFINDRIKRILVPLVFGILILSPHQVYFERLSHHQFTGTFFNFLPHYFSGLYAFGGNFAWMGLHLWYLLLLFIFSLITLPLLSLLKKRAQKWAASKVTLIHLLVFVVLLAIPGLLLIPDHILGSRVWGGWSMVEHLVLFVSGYYAFSKAGISNLLSKYRYLFLLITLLATSINIYLFVNHIRFPFGTTQYNLKILLRSLVCMAWISTLLGFAKSKLNYTSKFLKYGNEAVLPFYIIHQPVIILIGYFVVQLPLAIGIKYAVIVLMAFSMVMLCYDLLVRRFQALRFLFGMGLFKKSK